MPTRAPLGRRRLIGCFPLLLVARLAAAQSSAEAKAMGVRPIPLSTPGARDCGGGVRPGRHRHRGGFNARVVLIVAGLGGLLVRDGKRTPIRA